MTSRPDSREKGILWLKLSKASREMLLARFPPTYENIHCDHITLIYGCHPEEGAQYINKVYRATIYALARNDKVEAFRVNTNGLPDTYGLPHVTLSVARGVKPFESVKMLQETHEETSIEPSIEIEGCVEFIPYKSF